MPDPVPSVEDQRLAALERYAVLDTAAEASFDRCTALATRLFAAPIAVVSLVDRERLWFKSCMGLTTNQIEREGTFCGHAIQQDEGSWCPTPRWTCASPKLPSSWGNRSCASTPVLRSSPPTAST